MKIQTVIKDGIIQTLCRQCDMHCGLNVHIAKGKIRKVSGLKEHLHSRGRTCAKGRAAVDLVYHPDRLLKPLKRNADGTFSEISHERAMDEIAEKIRGIKAKHGARALGAWTGEAVGIFQQREYARRFVHAFGSPNYFSADSVCSISRHMAYCMVQGYWEPYTDYEHSDVVLLWGTNFGITHMPYMNLIDNARKRGAKLIAIDPRRTQVARKADIFAQILPGTDGALAWGLARYLIQNKSYDREFVENYSIGFDIFEAYARKFTLNFVEAQTGIKKEMIIQIGEMIAQKRPKIAVIPGISLEHQPNGSNTIRAIACLAGLAGAVDTEGGALWPEAMGTRALTLYDELPLLHEEPVGADKYPLLYQLGKECHSISAMDYMLGRGEYPLRGLIVTGANPVLSNPHAKKVREAFSGLDLLVFKDLFLTASAKLANYVLPAASFLERSEMHVQSYRQMVTLSTRVLEIPGVQTEYEFWHELAHRLGLGESYFPWEKEEDALKWILEPTGIDLEELKTHPQGYVYRPMRYKKYRNRPFPTSSGKYEFVSLTLKQMGYPEIPVYQAPAYREQPDSEYPLVLITGARMPLYLHSRYRNIERFKTAVSEPGVEIHPQDAEKLGIEDGERVRVISQIGAIEVPADIMPANGILPGFVQISHGWDEANVNLLTDDRQLDPISGFPNLKLVAVKIEKKVERKHHNKGDNREAVSGVVKENIEDGRE